MGQTKENGELQYYDVPRDEYVVAMCGEPWQRVYGMQEDRLHYHNLLEIGVCREEEGEIFVDGAKFVHRGGGCISIIPPHCLHRILGKWKDAWDYLYIDTDRLLAQLHTHKFAQLVSEGAAHRPYVGRQESVPEMMQLVNGIMYEMCNKRTMYQESVYGMVTALLVQIVRMDSYLLFPPEEADSGFRESREFAQIRPALEHIRKNYMSSMKVAELAAICHMSESHFRRVFEANVKMTPVDYLNKVRIKNACTLIHKTGYSMEEVSQRVGFATTSTFNRNFKRITGSSPYQWKRETDYIEV